MTYCVTLLSGIQILGEFWQSVLHVYVHVGETNEITRVAALQILKCLMAFWRLCALWWGFEVPVGVSARMSLYFVYRWNVVWHIVLRCFHGYRLLVSAVSLFCVYA